MAGIKELKTRIRSIQSTRKITRAMQMVSAAKMRKAQNAVFASRTYASLAWELINGLSKKIQVNNPLLASFPKARKIGVLILSTNRGFVGSLNTNLFTKLKELEKGETELLAELITYGKNARTMAVRLHKHIAADFEKLDKTVRTEEVLPLAQFLTDAYKTGEYKKIVVIYNHFVSTLTQKPTIRELLPFSEGREQEVNDFEDEDSKPSADEGEELELDYIFEPTPQTVLQHLIPRIVESQIYQTILESDASEHSARMVMMKNATEAAGDLISDLTLTFNQLRQNKITTELAEITAGKIALE